MLVYSEDYKSLKSSLSIKFIWNLLVNEAGETDRGQTQEALGAMFLLLPKCNWSYIGVFFHVGF